MSIKVMAKVFEWSESEGTDRLVMLALADFCDDDGVCFPGVNRIAKKCRISERTAQRAFKALETIGELIIDRGAGVPTKSGPTNRFRVLLSRGDNLPPLQNRGDNPGIEGVTTEALRGDSLVTQTISKPSDEPSGDLLSQADEVKAIESAWNSLPSELPKIRSVSDGRAKTARVRLKNPWWRENWRAAMAMIPGSDFLCGRTSPGAGKRPFVADIDFFLRPDSVAKILEGKYGSNSQPKPEAAHKKYL